MAYREDHTGLKYGLLTVIRKTTLKYRAVFLWECLCECGTVINATASNLKGGTTKSCGCSRRKMTGDRFRKHGNSRGDVYAIYYNMRIRCYDVRSKYYKDYGGRGIKVCDRWMSDVNNFLLDMGERPSKKHSLDRIDNNGDYCPENCRWATKKMQAGNTRTNVWHEYADKRMILADWAIYFKINPSSLTSFIQRNGFPAAYVHYTNKLTNKV